jgi:hypothetical protein
MLRGNSRLTIDFHSLLGDNFHTSILLVIIQQLITLQQSLASPRTLTLSPQLSTIHGHRAGRRCATARTITQRRTIKDQSKEEVSQKGEKLLRKAFLEVKGEDNMSFLVTRHEKTLHRYYLNIKVNQSSGEKSRLHSKIL